MRICAKSCKIDRLTSHPNRKLGEIFGVLNACHIGNCHQTVEGLTATLTDAQPGWQVNAMYVNTC